LLVGIFELINIFEFVKVEVFSRNYEFFLKNIYG